MEDNLVFYLNKLSNLIVAEFLDKEKNLHPRKKDERYFRRCIQRVRQKGCDVLLKKSTEPLLEDPCITDYGGNWSPATLITDYGRELRGQGAGKCYDVILNSIKILEENQYDCVNELLKLMLLLKKPFGTSSTQFLQHLSFSGSDFSKNSIDSFFLLVDDYSNNGLSRRPSLKKAIQYEESWTKHFDSKFQILGELSKKNLLTPDKVSLDSIFTAKSVNKSQSHSNSFVFTDFFTGKNYQSDKSLFYFNSDTSVDENPLLDSFVDNPITHKLPSLSISQKHFSKSLSLEKSSDQLKRKLYLLSGDKSKNSSKNSLSSDDIEKEKFIKTSEIDLKRNSNCSHSFSILYEKSNSRSQESSLGCNVSSMLIKERKKDKNPSVTTGITSKEIILGLWEQEQSLIKNFRPELAVNFPALRMISVPEFVEDVKYLLTGINSGTFQYSSNNKCFNMEYGTCLDDVTPESLYHFSKEFLDIGNCYMRLSSVVSNILKNNFDTCTTISQAFWKSIFDFLELHYSVVLEIPSSTNLMALKSCTRDMLEMMTTLAEICKVSKPDEELPQGGELLTYLLQVAEKLNRKCIINIVFGILQNCCTVYFMCILQTWMFKGKLEKQNNEFFVDCRRQKIKIRSRAYYNSFFIANEKVPGFLKGYEESIFNCGKSIHFLKLFNPEDKFCQLLDKSDYPNMSLCHSEEQLEKLEKKFEEYRNRVVEFCGGSISIKDLRNEEKEQEKCFIEYVKECKKIQEQQKELMRIKEIESAKAKKEKQNKLLNEQKNLIAAKKEKERLQKEAEEKKLEEEIRKEEEKKGKALEEQKSFIKKYYDELLINLEKQLNIAELRKQHLKELIDNEVLVGSETNDIMDVINENKVEVETDTAIKDINYNTNASETLIATVEGLRDSEIWADTACQKKSEEITYDENLNPSSTPNSEIQNQSLIASPSSVNNNHEISPVPIDNKPNELHTNEDNSKGLPLIDNNNCEGRAAKRREKMWKSVSHRTVAAQEAAKNKCKVLKSEFGFRDKEPKIESQPQSRQNSLSDLERNKRKVLESEYDILKHESSHCYVKSAPSKTEISKENNLYMNVLNNAKPRAKASENFDIVELQRKIECTDLENPPEVKKCENEAASSDSSISFFTPSNDMLSDENASNCDPLLVEGSVLTEEYDSATTVLNPKYQVALKRDAETFFRKASYQNIFCNLKEMELDSSPCTDFMKLQRFLKKSALIPLKIQEKLANDALLKHLLLGENLLSHLKSLRGYFFLNDGEFGRSFTYNTFRSLAKCTEPQQFFERSNLSNIVNEALNYTIRNSELNSQNLSFQIVKMPPFLNHSSHDVLSPFELSYKVDWPLNIILTDKALARYKSIFRFLLKLKRINWTLNENFLLLHSHFKTKKLNMKVLVGSAHYHKIQIYRHAMTQIMITLDEYIFSNGIQFPWMFFLKDLETTENIDHLYQKHVRYIKDVLTRCFLSKNSEDLLACIHNLIELALKFHYTTKSSMLEVVEGKYEHPKFDVLKNTFNEFCAVLKTFLRTLKEKISTNQVLRSHYILIEKFDLKLT